VVTVTVLIEIYLLLAVSKILLKSVLIPGVSKLSVELDMSGLAAPRDVPGALKSSSPLSSSSSSSDGTEMSVKIDMKTDVNKLTQVGGMSISVFPYSVAGVAYSGNYHQRTQNYHHTK
jgi:hypothetical protein